MAQGTAELGLSMRCRSCRDSRLCCHCADGWDGADGAESELVPLEQDRNKDVSAAYPRKAGSLHEIPLQFHVIQRAGESSGLRALY